MATRAMTIETAESEEIGLERLLCHRVTALSNIMNRLAGLPVPTWSHRQLETP